MMIDDDDDPSDLLLTIMMMKVYLVNNKSVGEYDDVQVFFV